MSTNQNRYAAPHVWNLTAKILREKHLEFRGSKTKRERHAVEDVALAFAERFEQDEGFDPLHFLDMCSSNTDLYPLSELWGK